MWGFGLGAWFFLRDSTWRHGFAYLEEVGGSSPPSPQFPFTSILFCTMEFWTIVCTMEFWTIVIYFNVTPLNLANQQKTWRSSPVHCIREEAREVEEGEGRREKGEGLRVGKYTRPHAPIRAPTSPPTSPQAQNVFEMEVLRRLHATLLVTRCKSQPRIWQKDLMGMAPWHTQQHRLSKTQCSAKLLCQIAKGGKGGGCKRGGKGGGEQEEGDRRG